MTKKQKDMLLNQINELLASGYGDAMAFYAKRQVSLVKQGMWIGVLGLTAIEMVHRIGKKVK